MKVSILSIGDELLIGQITNTNAAWIGAEFSAAGIEVVEQLTVGDDARAIGEALEHCRARSEVVIVTGGLGPTHDDVTVEAVAARLGLSLTLDRDWLSRMEQYFKSLGRGMPPGNEKQAMLPEGAERIDNDCGTAPGAWIESAGFIIALTPGVPYEMQSMLKRVILPRLAARVKGVARVQKTIYTTGVGESALAAKCEQLDPPLSSQLTENLKLAWLPSPLGVRLRLTASAPTEAQAVAALSRFEAHLLKAAAPYVFGEAPGTGEVLLEAVVGEMLRAGKLTVAVAESCTGGLAGSRLTNIPGSSSYFVGGIIVYSNDVKTSTLGVSAEVLTKFGAVSEECARAMAEGAREMFKADIGLAVTGIAGPEGGSPEKPVGLVWIALAGASGTIARKFLFERDRARNRERAAQAALEMLRRRLLKA